MCMAKEGHRPPRLQQTRHRLIGSKNVFVLVFNRTMNEGEPIYLDRAPREILQIPQVLRKELAASPFHCCTCHRIEILEIGNTTYSFVMITTNDGTHERTDALHDLIRVWAIANHVSETDRLLPQSCAGLECCLERGCVRVHVAKYQPAHGKIAETAAEETEL